MSADVKAIRKALRDEGTYRGRDALGNEWTFNADEEGEVYGYREVRSFGYQDTAADGIAAFLAGGPTP